MELKPKTAKHILRISRNADLVTEIVQEAASPWLPIAAIMGIVAALAFVWLAPFWAVSYHLTFIHLKMTPKDVLDFESGLRGQLIQLLGGLAVLAGSFVAYRNVKAAEKNVKVSEQGQITERFTRAIDQLGSDKIEVRLGGIYALERIARDSERDHRTIMEILSAYVRVRRGTRDSTLDTNTSPTDTEVQAILTVIGRRAWSHELDGHDLGFRSLDLHGLSLRNAYLDEMPFDDANLNRVNFEGAKLERASFRNASLEGAKLKGLDLSHVDFEGARLANADLTGCNLVEALHLTAAQVYPAHTKEAAMTEAIREELKRIWKSDNENRPPALVDTQKAQELGMKID